MGASLGRHAHRLGALPSLQFHLQPVHKSAPLVRLTSSGSLQGGQLGTWMVDPTQTPAVNRGSRDWHADLYSECKNRNREIVTAGSMELVNPPAGFAAVFPTANRSITDVGFGNLHSTHCAQSSAMLAYQNSMFDCITDLQNAAGLIPACAIRRIPLVVFHQLLGRH